MDPMFAHNLRAITVVLVLYLYSSSFLSVIRLYVDLLYRTAYVCLVVLASCEYTH